MSTFFAGAKDRIKGRKNQIFWAILAILGLVLAFSIGELYGKRNSRPPIIIEKCTETAGL
jgi:hypothetical protein